MQTFYVSVACVFKNESHILKEFIDHNLFHGVDHLYMINDMSSDNYSSILAEYGDRITLYHNDIVTNDVNRQSMIYNKYLKPILGETQWLAVIDLDEFMYSPSEINLQTILKRYEDSYDSLRVDWRVFGSNQCYYQPLSVVAGFNKYRDPEKAKREGTHSYKTIFKTQFLIDFGLHSHTLSSHRMCIPDDIIINHYQIQSHDFYMRVKATRGDATNYYDHIGIKRDLDFFIKNDDNTIECNQLIDQNREITRHVKQHKVESLTDNEVTVVITTCNRSHLLRVTLDSFLKFNTYPIKEFVIIEDSGKQGINDFLIHEEQYKPYRFNLIYNLANRGQVPSIDIAYEYVTTKYIFHCEEDWQFKKSGFIEASFEILDKEPNVFTVWLRPHNHTNGHPIEWSSKIDNYYRMSSRFTHEWRGKMHTWCGFTFNPGLRRTLDVLKFHPFCVNVEKNPLLGEVDEYIINTKYMELGYGAAITDVVDGYCDHIGALEHVPRSYEIQ